MGATKRNASPDGSGRMQEADNKNRTIPSFDGIKAIREHHDHVARLRDYLCARTKEVPDLPLTCHTGCHVAQWMHSESVKECANRKLIDAVCKRCEEFHEIAAQSVLLTKRDLPEPASDVLQSALDFRNASKRFQEALTALHLECRLNQ